MSAHDPSPRHRLAAGLLGLAQVGHAHWFFGNLYEAIVKVPDLLARHDGGSNRGREGGLAPFGRGSPVRYYAVAMPATAPAVLAAVAFGWDKRASRSWLAAAAACSVFSGAAGAYLVRTVNMQLFFSAQLLGVAERDRLLRTWHRVNAVRLVVTTGALLAAYKGRLRLLQ